MRNIDPGLRQAQRSGRFGAGGADSALPEKRTTDGRALPSLSATRSCQTTSHQISSTHLDAAPQTATRQPAPRRAPSCRDPAVLELGGQARAGPLRRPRGQARQPQGSRKENVLSGRRTRYSLELWRDGELNISALLPSHHPLACAPHLQLSKKYHPDAPSTSEGEDIEARTRRFHAISEAYSTLSDDGQSPRRPTCPSRHCLPPADPSSPGSQS